MASRNRGKRKPKLRDFSQASLTYEETFALFAAIEETSPISTAILGTVAVEHELELLLRECFYRKDAETWADMVSEQGPFNSFSRKIAAGYAFGIIDAEIRHNLNIVRSIRNTFAHSRELIDFDHPLIRAELESTKCPRSRTITKSLRDAFAEIANLEHGTPAAYSDLCHLLAATFFHKQEATKKIKRVFRRRDLSPIAKSLLDRREREAQQSHQQSLQGAQSDDPTLEVPSEPHPVVPASEPKRARKRDK